MERRAGPDGRELRLVADKDQPRRRPLRDFGEQFGVDHARLVNDYGFAIQVRPPEAEGIALVLEHTVNRARVVAGALAQPGGGLAREGAYLHVHGADGVRDGADYRGLACAGASVDDGEATLAGGHNRPQLRAVKLHVHVGEV